jgi:hypothetical protein
MEARGEEREAISSGVFPQSWIEPMENSIQFFATSPAATDVFLLVCRAI